MESVPLPIEATSHSETFVESEVQLQIGLEIRLAQANDWTEAGVAAYHELIDRRLAGFWATWPERYPEVSLRWRIIATALDLLVTSDQVEAELKQVVGGPSGILGSYIGGWYLLDTQHRHLEQRSHLFDFDTEMRHRTTEKLIARARKRYMAVGGSVAEAFVRALERTKFTISDYREQVKTYTSFVRPALKEGKVAYVLVDALRYEMARELADSVGGEGRRTEIAISLETTIATVPTITPIGMASLMPGAESGAQIVPVGGNLGLQIDNIVLKDRSSRVEWFKAKHKDQQVAVATMEDVLSNLREPLRSELKHAEIILLTSQEIDMAGESGHVRNARRIMDDILADLAKLAHKLRDLGCRTVVITADHGYVFGDEPDTDMKIAPPGGQKVSLHSRAWVGRGGTKDPAFLRADLADFGLSNDLEIAVPYGFGVFLVPGGAKAYFHGGMSPQEIVVPVLVLTNKGSGVMPLIQLALTLTAGSKKISTRFYSVQIAGQAGSLVSSEAPRVRVEIRVGGEGISQTVSAAYGLLDATGDVQLRFAEGDNVNIEPNTLALMITKDVKQAVGTVHLIDSSTGIEIAQISSVEIDISI